MRKLYTMLTILVMSFILTSCGEEEIGVFLRTDKGNAFFDEDGKYFGLGLTQSKESTGVLYAEKKTDDAGKRYYSYISKTIGQDAANELFSATNGSAKALLDNAGNVIAYKNDTVWVYTNDGNLASEFKTDYSIRHMIQPDSGKYYAIISSGGEYEICEFDIEKGSFIKKNYSVEKKVLAHGFLTAEGKNLYIFSSEGLFAIDKEGKCNLLHSAKDSALKTFQTDSPVIDVKLKNTELLTVLHSDGFYEELSFVYLGKDREVMTIREGWFNDEFIKSFVNGMIDEYNSVNGKYYIKIEEYDEKTDNRSNFDNKTRNELESGKLDLMFMNTIDIDNPLELIEKGSAVELSAFLERENINPSDYYPIVFNPFCDALTGRYAVNLAARGAQFYFDSSLITDVEGMNVKKFLETLRDINQPLLIVSDGSPLDDFILFAKTSESLFGSIDWDKRICDLDRGDFKANAELIKEIITKEKPTAFPIGMNALTTLEDFYSREEAYNNSGYILAGGVFFDDGFSPVISSGDELMICSNSHHVEGAEDFLKFLLSDYAQSLMPEYKLDPSKRSADLEYSKTFLNTTVQRGMVRMEDIYEFNELIKASGAANALDAFDLFHNHAENLSEQAGRKVTITAETIDEYFQFKEMLKPYPVRVQPLIPIVEEELGAFFDGAKTLDAACEILEKRINIYLSEKD